MANRLQTELLQSSQWPEWNTFVQEQPQGTVFHRTEWLNALCNDVSVLVCRDGQGAIVAGVPLLKRPLAKFSTFRAPMLTPYHGPVLSRPRAEKNTTAYTEQKEKLLSLLAGMPAASWIRFTLPPDVLDTQPYRWHGYRSYLGHTYRIAPTKTADEVWSEIDSKQRNTVRKAQKQGLVVETTLDLDAFLPAHSATFARQGLSVEGKAGSYRRMWSAAVQLGAGRIYIARDSDGKICAGQLVVWDPRAMYCIMSGVMAGAGGTGAGALILWQAIQDAIAAGQTFDFEGSTLPGVERYYRAWGGTLCPVALVEKVASIWLRPLVAEMWRKASRKHTDMFRAMMAELSNR
ncbi:MAG: GNAT family N-acetyltransferase [Planctomycetes bacterium]|nr:GNAT family N-acetyltransferase [Planctomycetota bacterium]